MKYKNIIEAEFIKRPNRFIAHVLISGKETKVHVKNTGRLKEILTPGTVVYLEKSDNPKRKTKYSLISAIKDRNLVNIDSHVPNRVIEDAIKEGKIDKLKNFTYIKREQTYKNSRFDFYLESNKTKAFIEVKSVTLKNNAVAMFPDAPTLRGTKHIKELIDAHNNDYECYIIFLLQMNEVSFFTPNYKADPVFSNMLKKAYNKGVNILVYDSDVGLDSININKSIPLKF